MKIWACKGCCASPCVSFEMGKDAGFAVYGGGVREFREHKKRWGMGQGALRTMKREEGGRRGAEVYGCEARQDLPEDEATPAHLTFTHALLPPPALIHTPRKNVDSLFLFSSTAGL